MEVVGCFIEYDRKFIILHRRPDKSQGDTCGLPAGKVNKNESKLDAVVREVKEEVGYLTNKNELEFLGDLEWSFPEKKVTFSSFRLKLKQPIEIKHQPNEHLESKWVTAEECYTMKNLIPGFQVLLESIGYVKK